eukprot:622322-Prymnesium_polylepis.1
MCATARKSWCAAPNFFHVHTPASTLPTRPNFENVPWGPDRAGGDLCATNIYRLVEGLQLYILTIVSGLPHTGLYTLKSSHEKGEP